MREVIQELVCAEAEAKRIVRLAREEAERLVADAGKRAQSAAAQARAETRVLAEKMIEAAVEEAQELKRRRLETAGIEVRQRLEIDPATTEGAVEAVVQFVCTNAAADRSA